MLLLSLVVGCVVLWDTGQSFEKSFRDALFQVVSVVTTTGYITADYTAWAPFLTMVFFLLMFSGGSAGSTAGGVKIVRHVLLLKNSLLEVKRQLHPSAVLPVRLNNKVVSQDIIYNVMGFIIIFISVFAIGTMAMAALGVDFETALGASASCLGNVGPGIGKVGPVDNFAHIPQAGKWILSFLMLIGRLELFTVLMLFSAGFWRKGG